MIKIFLKILIAITLTISLSTFAFSDDHKSSKEIINDLKSEIKELDAKPVKSKFLQRSIKYIEDLKEQRDVLLKEKEKKEKIEKEPTFTTMEKNILEVLKMIKKMAKEH